MIPEPVREKKKTRENVKILFLLFGQILFLFFFRLLRRLLDRHSPSGFSYLWFYCSLSFLSPFLAFELREAETRTVLVFWRFL